MTQLIMKTSWCQKNCSVLMDLIPAEVVPFQNDQTFFCPWIPSLLQTPAGRKMTDSQTSIHLDAGAYPTHCLVKMEFTCPSQGHSPTFTPKRLFRITAEPQTVFLDWRPEKTHQALLAAGGGSSHYATVQPSTAIPPSRLPTLPPLRMH